VTTSAVDASAGDRVGSMVSGGVVVVEVRSCVGDVVCDDSACCVCEARDAAPRCDSGVWRRHVRQDVESACDRCVARVALM
jgi:hypothetical protein